MTLNGFLFILASALFHVLWNTFLKVSEDKPSSVLLMMGITVTGMAVFTLISGQAGDIFLPSVLISAFLAGFFFFLYQYFVARAYGQGQLSQVYPLTVTAPLYIAIWSTLLLGERISLVGGLGIVSIVIGAMTIQGGDFRLSLLWRGSGPAMNKGVVFAFGAAFFYSFGAVADKVGVTSGQVSAYTMDLCVFMLLFHVLRMSAQRQVLSVMRELRTHPMVTLGGGLVMMLSFITFRIGLQEVHASYASALRQVSTVFGLAIGFFVFRESIGARRVISTLIILAGAVLIKMG
jgi:drug/metabolite transporter (DMT)-like permease